MTVMWTVILKNNTISDVLIDDIGLPVDATSQVTISDQFTYDEIAASDDLRDLVIAGTLVLNDGTTDLTTAEAEEFLKIVHVYYLKDNYYTKDNLGTSGQSSVHWDNITDKPSFGSLYWLDPVKARALTISSAAPVGTEGDFYIDSDDNHLYKYISSAWVDQGASATDDRAIILDTTGEDIYTFSGSAWVLDEEPTENSAVTLQDDGDGKQAIYVFNGTNWVKIADVDSLGGSLDAAYDFGGAGAGRTINVDSGAVKLDASGGYAPIEFTNLSTAPTQSLGGGLSQMAVIDDRLFVYDSTASLFVSVHSDSALFGRKGGAKDQYLYIGTGNVASNVTGYPVEYDGLILSIVCQLESVGTCDIIIYKNNDLVTPIATLSLTGSDYGAVQPYTTLSAEDQLHVYCSSSAVVRSPIVKLDIAETK